MIRTVSFLFFFLLAVLVYSQQRQNDSKDAQFKAGPVQRINTSGSDISPFFVNDLLYFTAVPQIYLNKPKREKQNTAFYSMYSAKLNEEGMVTSNRELVAGFGADIHEGPGSYCERTGELFVTLSNTLGLDTREEIEQADKIRLRLAVMKQINGVWKKAEELPFNDSRFHFAHPAINKTGDTLIFSSDLDSVNFGNSDLYMSVRESGQWSDPVNLGYYINTNGNELFPRFLPGGLLSFATDGRTITFGGLDIYYVSFPELKEVKIFDKEINSGADDFGLVIHKNGKSGYFSSNRNSISGDDIYRVEFEE